MKSPFTGKEMKLRKQAETVSFRGEEFTVIAHFYYCQDTQEEVTIDELDDITLNQLYNQYRSKYNIPFTEEIIALRKKYRVSKTEMSEILGFGKNVYSNYEKGEVPSRSNGNTLQMIKKASVFRNSVKLAATLGKDKKQKILQRLNQLEQEKITEPVEEPLYSIKAPKINIQPSHEVGYQKLIWAKIEAMIKQLVQIEPFTIKLNKLLFYCDFGHYKRTGFSISGIPYRAIAMGPVPSFYANMYEYLVHKEVMNVRSVIFEGNIKGKQYYTNGKELEGYDLLKTSEQEVIKKVIERFENTSTSKIVKLSHEEQAWQAHQANNEIIDYTHAFYLKHL